MKISSFAPSRASAMASKYPAALTNLQKEHRALHLRTVRVLHRDLRENVLVSVAHMSTQKEQRMRDSLN